MQRRIAHIDLDAFFVSVERVKNPDLVGKPVIVGGTGSRGVVSSCSYEARQKGVRSAMPAFKARALCPDGIFVRGNMADYSAFSRKVTDIICGMSPLVEKASIDEFYIDLTGMDKYLQPWQLLIGIKQRIKDELKLPVSFALAPNKLLSKIATNEVKPNGLIEVPAGTEAAYLAPLDISKMPGLGPKTEQILRQNNIHTLSALAGTSTTLLQQWLGKNGFDLQRKALGIDDAAVVPARDQKSISAEETFASDTTDLDFLEKEILRLLEKACGALRKRNLMAGCIGIKLRYQNFDTLQHQKTVSYTANESNLLTNARLLLSELWDNQKPVRLIGIRLTQLIQGQAQLLLFDGGQEQTSLLQALDAINASMGAGTVRRAGTVTNTPDSDATGWHNRLAEKQ